MVFKLSSLIGFIYVLFGFAMSAGLGYFAVGGFMTGQLLWGIVLGGLAYAFAWYSFGLGKQHIDWLVAVPQARLVLTNTGVEWPRGYVAFQDIQHVRCEHYLTQKRQNFMEAGTDHNVLATLFLREGKKLNVVGGQGSFTWFGETLGKKEAESLLEKVAEVQRRTFSQRFDVMLSSFDRDGYLFYDGKKLDSSGVFHFSEIRVPLSQFWLSDHSAELFSRSKNGSFHRSGKLRTVSLTQDRDVFFAFVKVRFGLSWPSRGAWAQR